MVVLMVPVTVAMKVADMVTSRAALMATGKVAEKADLKASS